jgi:formiminotetrahydrofolate cyclodeaminase
LEENYLKLPADQLLEKFGEGSHVPGSGSAAAFSGLLGVELMRTVCKLTLKREEDKYVQIRREFIIIMDQVDKVKLTLIELFQKDASIFNDVSKYRTLRDVAKDNNNEKDQRKYTKLANDKLKEATEIPLEIAKTCLNLIDYGFTIFDKGFQSARGDSGVAISNLLSAISGSLFVTLLNIRTGRKSQWTEKLREDAEKIGQNYSTKQKLALTKVLDLYKEGIDIKDYQLKLSFE